jgi:hypothetical protein
LPVQSSRLTNQLKGLLLEEAILLLLRNAGYTVVEYRDDDPTLGQCSAGLQVRGRGGDQQIDAVADYVMSHPFVYPLRLLVEAKCYAAHRAIDLEIVRNALGVFQNVAEYWTSPPGISTHGRRRYHYQYAVFASSDFTKPA